jgi:PLP dependent protein
MPNVAENLEQVRQRIRQAVRDCNRDPAKVHLIAVSKRQPGSAIREAYAAGQRDFGENYVQELRQKANELADLADLRWHMIGHLQRNKAKHVTEVVSVVHTVDSVELALELDRRAQDPTAAPDGRNRSLSHAIDARLPVLVEVNVGGEEQKSGCEPHALGAILTFIEGCTHLQLVGLMTVPPFTDEPADSKPFFDKLVAVRERHGGCSRLPDLSMGMTLDLEYAVAAGATMVRVGTAIFGERT